MKKIIILNLLILCGSLFASQAQTGQELFFRMSAAVGNVEKIENIQSTGEVAQHIADSILQLPVKVIVHFPDKLYFKLENKEYIVNGEEGWIKYDKGYYESLSGSDLKQLQGNLSRNLIYLLKYSEEFIIEIVEYIRYEEREYALLSLNSEDIEYILWLDLETYLPFKLEYKPDNDLVYEKFYLEFREIDNIKIPVHTKTFDKQGSIISENTITDLRFNDQIDPKLFQ